MKDTESKVETTRGGYRFSTSLGGTLTGIGSNLIIVDDAMSANDAYSERARENVKDWHSGVLLSRLNNKVQDAIVVVMQRLHHEDYAGFLIEQGGWHHLNLPAIAEHEHAIALGPNRFHIRRPGDLLHPEREPLFVLEELRRTMGSAGFSAQYLQQPEPEDGDLIRWSWFRFYDEFPGIEPNDRIIVSWDTAMSAKELASYSVGIVMVARGETVYLLDVIRKHLEYPDLKRKVIEIHRRYRNLVRYYALLIENKGSGMNLIQDLRRERIYAVPIVPQTEKIIRMTGQLPRVESGSVFLPRSAHWLDEFRREIRQFPRGRHDDQVDALSQGLQYLVEWQSRRCYVGAMRGSA
jgi:predicted phage terminase large subunit-like protein